MRKAEWFEIIHSRGFEECEDTFFKRKFATREYAIEQATKWVKANRWALEYLSSETMRFASEATVEVFDNSSIVATAKVEVRELLKTKRTETKLIDGVKYSRVVEDVKVIKDWHERLKIQRTKYPTYPTYPSDSVPHPARLDMYIKHYEIKIEESGDD